MGFDLAFKKNRISGLNRKTKFQDAAKFILDQKLKQIFKEANKFRKNDSCENLHSLRIAFRRFRYLLETFSGCYGEKHLNRVNRRVQKIQDLLGEARDVDVLNIKLKKWERELAFKIPEILFKRMDEEILLHRRNIKMELIKFTSNKDVNSFLKKSGKSEK